MATPPTNAKIDANRRPTLLGVSSLDGITPVALEANPLTGGLIVEGGGGGGTSGLVTVAYDSITYTNTSTTVDTYTYKSGASTVATVTITYTDTTKSQISSVART